MPHDPTLTLSANLEILKQEVDRSYLNLPVSSITKSSDWCWMRKYTSSTKPGAKVLIPIAPWTSTGEKKRPFQKQRVEGQEVFNIEVVHDLNGPKAGRMVDIGTREEEIYDMVERGLAQMMTAAQGEYDRDLVRLIGGATAGITPYDLKPHFATNKEVLPTKPGLNTFRNYQSALKLDKAGLLTVFDAMDSHPWYDNELVEYGGKLVVVVSNDDQYDRACEQLKTSQKAGTAVTAGATGIAVATTDNCLQGRADVVKWTLLRKYYGAKAWMVLRIIDDMHRPFIHSMVFPPRVKYEGEALTDHLRVLQSAFAYAWEGMWGMGLGDPRLSYLCVEP